MIKTLIKVQLRSLFVSFFTRGSGAKKRGAGFRILIGLLVVYIVAALSFTIGVMFYPLAEVFPALGVGWLYWAVASVMCVVASFVFTVFSAGSHLFDAKDNELLMSMPIRPGHILFARMFSFYLVELLFTLMVLVPVTAVQLLFHSLPVVSLLAVAAGALLLPMLALALAAAAGWLISLISSRMKRKNLASFILMTLVFIGFMAVYMNMYRYIMELAESGLVVAEIFKKALPFAYHFGLAAEGGSLPSLLILLLWCLTPAALVYFIISKNFIRIATTNRGTIKTKYVEKPMKSSGLRAALLKKEFAYFMSVPYYMFNNAFGLVMLLLYSGALFIKGRSLIDSLLAEFGGIPSLPADGLLIAVAAAVLCFCVVMTVPACVSLSLEGKNLWILKSSPIRFSDVMFAKIGMNVVISLPFILLAVAATAFVIPMGALDLLAMLLLPLSAQLFAAVWGFTINLLLPKFDFQSETQVIKQSASASIGVLGCMAFIAAPVVLFFVFGLFASPIPFLYVTAAAFLLLSGLLLLYLCNGGAKRFDRISA